MQADFVPKEEVHKTFCVPYLVVFNEEVSGTGTWGFVENFQPHKEKTVLNGTVIIWDKQLEKKAYC